jgi:hypothetical protein
MRVRIRATITVGAGVRVAIERFCLIIINLMM